jgi:N-acetylmuramoyl-L-alanine amidase
MSRLLDKASLFSVGLTLAVILFSADGSGASAQNPLPLPTNPAPLQTNPEPAAQAAPTVAEEAAADVASAPALPAETRSLTELVAAQDEPGSLSPELRCLAGAIYFEAKSESLEGQYAVGRVIVARSKSGRYPGSYCGVVYQPSQFSFVRGRSMPAIPTTSRDWREAVAIAQLSHSGRWKSPVEGALSFHATRVSPGWRMTRVAKLGNHVFYR